MTVEFVPGGILPNDLDLTLQMAPEAPQVEIVEVPFVNPPCIDPVFIFWRVLSINLADDSVIASYKVKADGNAGAPIPYPDGCFKFRVFLVGCYPAGIDCVEWLASFFDSSSVAATLDSLLLLTGPDEDPEIPECTAIDVFYNPAIPSVFGTLADTTLTLSATVGGDNAFGSSISFACDPAAFASQAADWIQAQSALDGTDESDGQTTFQQTPDGTLLYFMVLRGLLWDDMASVTWAVVQTAGPTVPDDTYFTVTAIGCSRWGIGLTTGYDYSGTIFNLTATYDGNPFGTVVEWTCEV